MRRSVGTIESMDSTTGDASWDRIDAERADEASTPPLEALRSTIKSFLADHQDSLLSPEVWVDVDPGAEEQPVFVVSLLVDLEDDLDPDDFPRSEVEALQDDLRDRISKTPVDRWDWIVTTGTKAGAARR